MNRASSLLSTKADVTLSDSGSITITFLVPLTAIGAVIQAVYCIIDCRSKGLLAMRPQGRRHQGVVYFKLFIRRYLALAWYKKYSPLLVISRSFTIIYDPKQTLTPRKNAK